MGGVFAAQRPRRWTHRVLAIWAILSPLLLLAGSSEWLYTPGGYLDPWDYVGFFLSYDQPEFLPGAYKLARLPWILSGWAAHQVFADATAPLVLHVGYLLLATAGMYVLVRQLFESSSVACIAAMLLGFYPHFHGSGGWDYHNAAAGAFHLWALASLTYAARRDSAVTLLASGALIALAIHANITLVNLVPLFAAHMYVVRRHYLGARAVGVRTMTVSVTWIIWGGLGATALLMSINSAVGRDPQFFRRLIEIVFRYTSDPSHQAAFWKPWGPWVFGAKYLIVPIATFLVSTVVLAGHSRRLPTLHALAIAEFVGLAVLWCVWQSLGQTALDWEYFAYPLIPQMFLAISALVHWRIGSIPAITVAAAPFAMAAALILNTVGTLQPFLPASPALAAFGVLVAFTIVGQTSLWLPPPRLGIVVFVIACSLINAVAAFSTNSYMARQPCQTGADFQAAVIAAHRFAAENDPALKDVTIWFREGEQLAVGEQCFVNVGYLGYAVAASGIPHLANPFPLPALEAIPDEVIADVTRPRRTLLVLSSEPEIHERVSRRFASMGIHATLTNTRTIIIAGGRLSALLFKLQPRTPS